MFRAPLIPLYDNNSFECQTMDEIDHIATKDNTYNSRLCELRIDYLIEDG